MKSKVDGPVRFFVDKWLEKPDFVDWLVKRKDQKTDKYAAYCICCHKFLSNALTALVRHQQSKSHGQNVNCLSSNQRMETFVSEQGIKKQVAAFELKILSFIAENNLPLSLVDRLFPLLRSLFPTDNVLNNTSCGKQKASNIIREGYGSYLKKKLFSKLNEVFFSLIVDETTDVSVIKQLAIMVQYWDVRECKLVVELLDMVKCLDGTAIGLTNSMKSVLAENGIDMKRFVGFGADTTNVMFGGNNSVFTILRNDNPNLLAIKCSCHSIHLVASYSTRVLPKFLEELCRGVFNYFSHSSKRREALAEFQEFFDVQKQVILSPDQTRWLSHHNCIKRLLAQYVPLRHYFGEESFTDPTTSNELLSGYLEDPITYAYLEFLDYALGLLTDFNTVFQSDIPLLFDLKRRVFELLETLASNFMKMEYVQRIGSPTLIDPEFATEYVHLERIYLGLHAGSTVEALFEEDKIDSKEKGMFYTNCRSFFISAIKEIKKRFSFEDAAYDVTEILLPANVRSLANASLSPLFNRFPILKSFVDLAKAESQFRDQARLKPNEFGCQTNDEVLQLSPSNYWAIVGKMTTVGGRRRFPELTVCVSLLLSVPCSNACSERQFSKLKLIKTDQRNALDNKTICSLMRIRSWLKTVECAPHNVVLPDELIENSLKVKANAAIIHET